MTRRLFMRSIGFAVGAIWHLACTPAHAQSSDSAVAPTGRLRAAMNLGNSILVVKDSETGELHGVTVDLSRSLAAKLGVPVTFVEYRNAGAVVDRARTGAWDI